MEKLFYYSITEDEQYSEELTQTFTHTQEFTQQQFTEMYSTVCLGMSRAYNKKIVELSPEEIFNKLCETYGFKRIVISMNMRIGWSKFDGERNMPLGWIS